MELWNRGGQESTIREAYVEIEHEDDWYNLLSQDDPPLLGQVIPGGWGTLGPQRFRFSAEVPTISALQAYFDATLVVEDSQHRSLRTPLKVRWEEGSLGPRSGEL